jgi:LytS/YehU family sensor histidine kinase
MLVHVLFSILLPIIVAGITYKYILKYIYIYITFLSVNLILNCFTYYQVVIEGNQQFAIVSIDLILLISAAYYFIFSKQIKAGIIQLQKEREKQVLLMFKTASNIMLGQMKPHFLYNTLNTIKYLITEDPQKAEYAIVKFSEYLRENMNALSCENFILFEQELKHIKNYVDIEKLRFGDRITVNYNIENSNFFLPSLSIQPLVENAIKHGITRKLSGGTVDITVKKEEQYFVVSIKDDGVGFDTNVLNLETGSLAIKNIKERIGIIEGASFEIKSVVNEGSECIVKIPQILPSNLKTFVKKEEYASEK